MSQILQPYEVALVNGDLSSPQTLSDVFYTLESLSKTIDEVFGRIEQRLEEEKNRLTQVNDRAGVCSEKVKLVEGSNQATTIFSTAKFPAPKTLPTFQTLFNQITEVV